MLTGCFSHTHGIRGNSEGADAVESLLRRALAEAGVHTPQVLASDLEQGFLLLEDLESALARGARPIAELVGYGMSGDGYHMTAPSPDGEGAARCMQAAIESAGITCDVIDYINAHGTSTPAGDIAETNAIKATFGEAAGKVAVSSTKSMIGHLLGAGGAVEAVACCRVIETGMLPPTINYEHPDPECDLDYVPNVARKTRVLNAMTNSFGFGGTNASLILGRVTE